MKQMKFARMFTLLFCLPAASFSPLLPSMQAHQPDPVPTLFDVCSRTILNNYRRLYKQVDALPEQIHHGVRQTILMDRELSSKLNGFLNESSLNYAFYYKNFVNPAYLSPNVLDRQKRAPIYTLRHGRAPKPVTFNYDPARLAMYDPVEKLSIDQLTLDQIMLLKRIKTFIDCVLQCGTKLELSPEIADKIKLFPEPHCTILKKKFNEIAVFAYDH